MGDLVTARIDFENVDPSKRMEYLSLDKDSFGSLDCWKWENFEFNLPDKAYLSFDLHISAELIGYIIGSSYHFNEQTYAHINRIAVKQHARSKGSATILIGEFLHQSNLMKCDSATLEFNALLKLDEFYSKNGFVQMTDNEVIRDYVMSKQKEHLLEQYLKRDRKVFIRKLS